MPANRLANACSLAWVVASFVKCRWMWLALIRSARAAIFRALAAGTPLAMSR
jgi:hypothetical protein